MNQPSSFKVVSFIFALLFAVSAVTGSIAYADDSASSTAPATCTDGGQGEDSDIHDGTTEVEVDVCHDGHTIQVGESKLSEAHDRGDTDGVCKDDEDRDNGEHGGHDNGHVPPPPSNGTIRICKIILDDKGAIATSASHLPQGNFAVTIKKGTSPASATDIGSVLWNTASWTPNADLIGNDGKNDALCKTFDHLAADAYFYSEESVTGSSTWMSPRYNDGYTSPLSSTSQAYAYSGELFTSTTSDDASRNEDADGHVVLTSARPERTIVVVNQYRAADAPTTATINATKITCDQESDLPNYGNGGPDITKDTASSFLSSHPNCHLTPDWMFQWGRSNVSDPGRTFLGEATSGWNTFGPTASSGIASVNIPVTSADTKLWVREVLKDGYLSFSYDSAHTQNDNPVSAEMYCSTDVLNYDNFDSIQAPQAGNTYTCVAWNVHTAVPTAPACSDGKDNDGDGKIDYPADLGCTDANDTDENNPPVITLIGANPLNLIINTPFVDPGATSTDAEDGVLIPVATGTVSTTTLGTYTIVYTATDSKGLTATTSRVVNVVPLHPECSDGIDNDHDGTIDFPADLGCTDANDNSENAKPVITVGAPNPMTIPQGSTFTAPTTTTASDLEDGDITSHLVATGTVDTSIIGTYTITYTVSDSQGLAADPKTRTVNVVSTSSVNTAPVITVTGSNPASVVIGNGYTDAGATATDLEDGDITSKIVATGTVDATVLGTYTITYTVVDSQGLGATTTRTVNVVNPSSTGGGGSGGGATDSPYPGCTNASATNYNKLANRDDGSCVYPTNAGGGGTGLGGGGSVGTPGLTIFNEHLTMVSETSALITWNTNLLSNSRVVYGTASPNPLGAAPGYGYTFTTVTIATTSATHALVVTNMPPNTIVYFRPISSDGVNTVHGIELSSPIVAGSCTYLEKYLRLGYQNDPVEVTKLQRFLHDLEGFTNLQVTGTFDLATDKAVRAFQDKYQSDVLTPWGLPQNTGYVYFTTKKKINEIYCRKAFPLDSAQLQEIYEFSRMFAHVATGAVTDGFSSDSPVTRPSISITGGGSTVENPTIDLPHVSVGGMPIVTLVPEKNAGEIGVAASTNVPNRGPLVRAKDGIFSAGKLLASLPINFGKSIATGTMMNSIGSGTKEFASASVSTSKASTALIASVAATVAQKLHMSVGCFWAWIILFVLIVIFGTLSVRHRE